MAMINVPDELKWKLKILAAQMGTTLKALTTQLLEESLQGAVVHVPNKLYRELELRALQEGKTPAELATQLLQKSL